MQMFTLFHTHALPHSPVFSLSASSPPQESQQYLDKYVKNTFSFDVIIIVEETEN